MAGTVRWNWLEKLKKTINLKGDMIMERGDKVIIDEEMVFGIIVAVGNGTVTIKTDEGFTTMRKIEEVSTY